MNVIAALRATNWKQMGARSTAWAQNFWDTFFETEEPYKIAIPISENELRRLMDAPAGQQRVLTLEMRKPRKKRLPPAMYLAMAFLIGLMLG